MLRDAYHDVPWQAPDLVAHVLADLRSPGSSDLDDLLAGLVGNPTGDGSLDASPNDPLTVSHNASPAA